MKWKPGERVETVSVAPPALIGTVPSGVPPSVKVTVPVGATEPKKWLMLAVRVTGWPALDGSGDEFRNVEVKRRRMNSLLESELAPKVPSPE